MSTLAVIPVRANSERVPNKAMRVVAGRTLLGHTVHTLQQIPAITQIVVTTNDPQVAGWARSRGLTVVDRSAHLALPDVPVLQPAIHAARALQWTGPVLLAQCTNPLLIPQDLCL